VSTSQARVELPRETLGERKLSTLDAVAQSLAIGPIFSGAFLTFLVVLQAGWNSLLSVILGSLGVLCLGWVVSVYARRYAGAGAIYEYLTRAVHPLVGIFASGVYFVALLFLGAGGVYLGIGFLVSTFTQTHDVGFTIDWWVAGLVAAVLVFLMNHFGVRLTVRTQLILSALSVTPLLILIVAVLAKGGDSGLTLSMLDPGKTGANEIFHGILFAVTLFIGFEAAASLGEETRDPKRSIPVAVLSTIALAAGFYVLLVYAVSVGFGEADIGKWGPTGVADIASRYVGDWLSTLIDIVVITDAFVLSLAFTVTAARGWFVLSRDGLLPRFLSKTSRHDTPLGGNLLTLVCAFGFLLWGAVASYSGAIQQAFGPNEFIVFQFTATTGSLGVELIYVLLALGAFGLIVRGRLPAWGYLLAAGAVATPILGIYGAVRPFPPYPLNRAIYIWFAVIAVALVYTAVVWATRPGRVQAAAAYATAEPAPGSGFAAPPRTAPEGEPLG
jgi:amino acid transporter